MNSTTNLGVVSDPKALAGILHRSPEKGIWELRDQSLDKGSLKKGGF